MTVIKRRASLIIIIAICLFILLCSSGFHTIYLTGIIEPDVQSINKLEILRGSIQRLVKLELNNGNNNTVLEGIDSAIDDFQMEQIKVYDNNNEMKDSLKDLKNIWIQLRQLIHIHRANPSEYNKKILIEKSEEIWLKANPTVFTSQVASQRKVENYKISFILFLINLTLVIIIIVLIKKYIKNTLESLAHYDILTNCFNKKYFNEFLKSQIKISERYRKDLSLIIFDIDHFKKTNEKYGYYIGDCVLKELSNLIKEGIRKSDVFARIAGEEFAIILPETSIEDALLLSERLRGLINDFDFKEVGKLTVSLGISQFYRGDTSNSLYKRADMALYKAKNNGKDRSEVEIKDESHCSN